jgi:hypothetical protein
MMRVVLLVALVPVFFLAPLYASPLEVEEVTLVATHRVYKNFKEEHTVKLGEKFFLADTEYTVEVVEFLPDFAINLEAKEIFSRSDEPNNPAVRIVIYENDEIIDEIWAFKGKGAPHFSRASLIAFELLEFKAGASAPSTATSETEILEDTPVKDDDSVEDKEDSEE